MKTCVKCATDKDRAEFTYCKTTIDNLRPWCKSCVRAYNKAYRYANIQKLTLARKEYHIGNRDKALKTMAKYYHENKEFVKAINNEWAKNNPSKVRDAKRKWSNNNKDYVSKKAKEWRLKNPDKCRITVQNYQSRKKSAGGSLSKDIFKRLMVLQRGMCVSCRVDLTLVKPNLDHIIPLFLGGSNTDSNIQLLCQSCNNSKHAKHPIDFMQERGFLL